MADERDGGETQRTSVELAVDAPSSSDLLTETAFGAHGRYALGALLGKGGMGEVRVCVDRAIEREVAIKVMRMDARAAGATSRGTREDFLREARVQGQTEHPSIVPVYDVGRDESGAPYFTMRRVEGKTLEAVLRSLRAENEHTVRAFSRHKLLTAFGSVCLAVHYAHTRAVFHCDLKPANIMLGGFGEVYVLDWGLATKAGQADGVAPDGQPRVVNGTPGYMAPEQVRGEAVDARSDVYALGVLLYEILTLQPMLVGKSYEELCASTLEQKIERPSARAPERNIAPELDLICSRATARAAQHRYATARDLYDDLTGYLDGDRDLALRRSLSRDHAARAFTMSERARDPAEGGGISARSEALRAVGRALALDPDNPEALRILVGLLTEPPAETPTEALEDIRANERSLDGPRARGGVIGLLLLSLLFPVACLSLGIRSVPKFCLTVVVGLATAGLGALRVQRPRDDGFAPTYLPVALSVLICVLGVCYNPTVLTPTFAIPFAVGYTLSMDHRRRLLPMIAASASIVIPSAMEWLHIVSPSATMIGDLACVVPRTGGVPLLSGPLYVLGNVICVVGACYYALRFREILTETQRRVCVTAWQLRQLLPKEARPATTTPPPA